jgi:hypothetical protein
MSVDPVAARRAQIARLVAAGKRVGYGLFLAAIVLFAVGMVGQFNDGLVTAIAACLIVGSLVLAPAIVFGYAVRAPAREEAGMGSRH